MGLDMYLEGRKFIHSPRPTEDGYPLMARVLELGYWRKHPNLHGYIVAEFAQGVDECQDINLTCENLEQIVSAVASRALPETEGFFFGKSDGADDQETTKQLKAAIAWLKAGQEDQDTWRSVVYRASW
jgi:hypothetical protein